MLPGDTLVTSGLGRVFPEGFPVGTVFQVAEEKTLEVGAVVMAPGYSLYDARRSPEWGYGL